MANLLSGRTSFVTTLGAGVGLSLSVLLAGCSSAASNPDATGSGGSNPAGGSNPGGGTMSATGGANPGGGIPNNGGTNVGTGGAIGGGGIDQGTGGVDQGTGGAPPLTFEEMVGTDPNRNNVPGGQVCDRIATIECAGEQHCCDALNRSFDQCKATMKQGCIDQLYLDAITSNPIAGYDMATGNNIFTAYEAKASQCDTTVTAWGASVEGLRGLAPGTLQSGQSCQPPLAMITDKPTAAAYLAACANPTADACYPTALKWTCSPRAGDGGKCFTDANCNDGLYCTNSKDLQITGGTCRARLAEGSPCSLPTECQSLLCKSGTCGPINPHNVFCLY